MTIIKKDFRSEGLYYDIDTKKALAECMRKEKEEYCIFCGDPLENCDCAEGKLLNACDQEGEER